MGRFAELMHDISRLWEKYASFYLDGIVNTLILALVAILGGAVFYIIRSKKKGSKCIGCPDSGCNGKCSGCNGCDQH